MEQINPALKVKLTAETMQQVIDVPYFPITDLSKKQVEKILYALIDKAYEQGRADVRQLFGD